MPIKGKGKGARRRTVAAGPKRGYVEPPKPFWRKRGFWWATAALVVAVLVAVLTPVFIHLGNVHRKEAAAEERRTERDKAGVIATQFRARILKPMAGITQDFGDTVLPLPDLSQQVSTLKPDEKLPEAFVKEARDAAEAAGEAADAIEKISTAQEISGHPVLLPLIDAQHYLVSAMRTYEQAGKLFVDASEAPADLRERLVRRAQALLPVASELFADGMQTITNVYTDLKLPLPQPQPQPSPSASPSASATPTETASPSPTATPKATPSNKSKGKSPSPSPSKKKKG